MKTSIDIFSLAVWFAAVVSAPHLRSMILYLPITYADLKIYLVNDLEDGRLGSTIHLYDHLSVSPANTTRCDTLAISPGDASVQCSPAPWAQALDFRAKTWVASSTTKLSSPIRITDSYYLFGFRASVPGYQMDGLSICLRVNKHYTFLVFSLARKLQQPPLKSCKGSGDPYSGSLCCRVAHAPSRLGLVPPSVCFLLPCDNRKLVTSTITEHRIRWLLVVKNTANR